MKDQAPLARRSMDEREERDGAALVDGDGTVIQIELRVVEAPHECVEIEARPVERAQIIRSPMVH